jgi:hypothetical protein
VNLAFGRPKSPPTPDQAVAVLVYVPCAKFCAAFLETFSIILAWWAISQIEEKHITIIHTKGLVLHSRPVGMAERSKMAPPKGACNQVTYHSKRQREDSGRFY